MCHLCEYLGLRGIFEVWARAKGLVGKGIFDSQHGTAGVEESFHPHTKGYHPKKRISFAFNQHICVDYSLYML
jgi:hypothetical protein